MAYPPTIPPATRTNNTPQVDDHPDDHNAISAALTDIVNELGADPKGDYASLTAYLAILDPIRYMQSPLAAAPTGWLLCDGSSVAAATYPRLFTAIGYTYGGAGANFNLPDIEGKFLATRDAAVTAFDTLGESGGSKDAVTVAHTHTGPSHAHTGTTASSGGHTHTPVTGASFQSSQGGTGFNLQATGIASVGSDTLAESGAHTHTITTDAGGTGNTGSSGSSGTDANLPPYIVVNTFVRAA
jgi:microcystin-dependent protein